MLAQLTAAQWLLLGVAAVVVGFAKTALGGVGGIAAVLFAMVLPARESTGALLPLLIAGDVLAVTLYRRHAQWGLLLRLLPWVVVGTVVGAGFVAVVDDRVMRVAIGVLLVLVSLLGLALRRSGLRDHLAADAVRGIPHLVAATLAGVLAGFATMVANAAGPVTTLYLLLSGLAMLAFLGTTAWFFLIVNVIKVPFSLGLGLISAGSLLLDAMLVPALLVGAGLGVLLIRRISQARFEQYALSLSAVAAAMLLL